MDKAKKLFNVYIVLIVVIVVLAFVLSRDKSDRNRALTSFGTDWLLDDGTEVSLDALPPIEGSDALVLHKILPEHIKMEDQLNLISNNIYFDVEVDDRPIYSYHPGENVTGKGYGSQIHYIALPEGAKQITISCTPIYGKDSSGLFQDVYIGSEEAYIAKEFRDRGASFMLAILIIFLGIFLFVMHIGAYGLRASIYNLPAMAIGVLMLGMWTSVKSLTPQLFFDNVGVLRVIDYGCLTFVGYPMVVFINSAAEKPNKIFEYVSFAVMVVSAAFLGICRFGFGIDVHNVNIVAFISIGIPLFIMIVIVIKDMLYNIKKNNVRNHIVFYVGVIILVVCGVLDIVRYFVNGKSTRYSGMLLQVGIVIFISLMVVQILRALIREHQSFDQQKFINDILQYSMSAVSPDESLDQMLEYLGSELGADRAYIFEDNDRGSTDNTYEWCSAGVRPEKDSLQNVPYEDTLDLWYDEFEKTNCVIIKDVDEYKEVNENVYNILKPIGIHSMIAGPLRNEEGVCGFFGVNNPPEESFKSIVKIIRLLEYFMNELIRQRDNQELLYRYSYVDSLTGVMNRRALDEMIEESLENCEEYGLVMCDINGLKKANDEQGHLVGDMMIQDVARCLATIYGEKRVFRTGGDEFLAICFDKNKNEFEEEAATIKPIVSEHGHSVSVGTSYCAMKNVGFNAVLKLADSKMYDDKAQYYKMHGDRRRR